MHNLLVLVGLLRLDVPERFPIVAGEDWYLKITPVDMIHNGKRF